MFKQLLTKLDRELNEWDFCDGYGTCVRWPVTGGQVVKHFSNVDNSTINRFPQKTKNVEELF